MDPPKSLFIYGKMNVHNNGHAHIHNDDNVPGDDDHDSDDHSDDVHSLCADLHSNLHIQAQLPSCDGGDDDDGYQSVEEENDDDEELVDDDIADVNHNDVDDHVEHMLQRVQKILDSCEHQWFQYQHFSSF